MKKMPPRPEPAYYTDEEYATLAKEREKIGLNQAFRTSPDEIFR
jgi:hypothetical protein